jgi:phage terminase small subunit
MSPPKTPKPPSGLKAPGKGLWSAIVADVSPVMELDARDLHTLTAACASADTIAALEVAVKKDGEILPSGKLNPAVVELRQQRVALMRLLSAVDLDERPAVTPTQRRASKAARARWANHREIAERRELMRGA